MCFWKINILILLLNIYYFKYIESTVHILKNYISMDIRIDLSVRFWQKKKTNTDNIYIMIKIIIFFIIKLIIYVNVHTNTFNYIR